MINSESALERPIEPRRFRWLFGGLAVGVLLVIWGAWLNGIHALQRNAESALSARIGVDTLLLEDHASRALDAVTARLQALSGVGSAPTQGVAMLPPAALSRLIADDPIIHSVSLVDATGRIVASSTAANLGLRLAPGLLPGPDAPTGTAGIRYGAVVAGRDLAEAGGAPLPHAPRVWIVAMPVQSGSETRHWVAALDPLVFERLWARLDENPATEMGLFDARGRRIATHHPVVPPEVPLAAELVAEAARAPQGGFVPGGHPKLWATYRSSVRHPVVMVAIGHQGLIWAALADERLKLTALAVGATLVLMLVLALVWRGYLRYEASVIETANQARAISAHLMSSEASPDGTILSVNQALLEASGYSRDEVVGKTFRIFDSGLHPPEFLEEIRRNIEAGLIWKGSFRYRRRDGSPFWVNATIIPFLDAWGRLERYVTLYSDATETIALSERINQERQLREELARANRDLATRANTDPLTGVATRHVFGAFVTRALEAARTGGEAASLLLLDIDRFKTVNDRHGHAAGDAVLRALARRWSERIRASDLLARLGGEEFCVVLPATEPAGALAIAEALRAVTSAEPVPLEDGGVLRVTVSIGIATLARGESSDVDSLMRAADSALYAAKHGGRNTIVVAGPAPGVAGRGPQGLVPGSGHLEFRGVGAAGDRGAADERVAGVA